MSDGNVAPNSGQDGLLPGADMFPAVPDFEANDETGIDASGGEVDDFYRQGLIPAEHGNPGAGELKLQVTLVLDRLALQGGGEELGHVGINKLAGTAGHSNFERAGPVSRR